MKKINLQKNILRTNLLSGGIVAVLVFSLFGISAANAMITSSLDFGSTGLQVTELQTYLATNVNIYPEGLVT